MPSTDAASSSAPAAPATRMYGEGGAIGPDLTGSNRANLEYLLSNVAQSKRRDAGRLQGRGHHDTRRAHASPAISRRRPTGSSRCGSSGATRSSINKADIQSRETTATSMMPTGLFDALSDREVIDLVAYLRTMRTGQGTATTMRPPSFLHHCAGRRTPVRQCGNAHSRGAGSALGFSFTNVARRLA